MKSIKKSFVIIVFLASAILIPAQVMFYRQLPEFELSTKFKVEVRTAKTNYKEIFVYQMDTGDNKHVTKLDHFGSFAFEPDSGAVTICVSLISGEHLTNEDIELVNKTYKDVSTTFENGKFIIHTPSVKKHLFVRLIKDYANPLMIFVDPIKQPKIPEGANVYTFAASKTPYIITNQFDRFTIPDDVDVVNIEDGALVKGTIHTGEGRTKPVILMGRGVVLGNGGILHGAPSIPYNAVVITKGIGNTIDGIMVIKSRHFSVDVGVNGTIDNVKMYGYDSNNDGVVAFDNSTIKNCYFKVNDDHVKVYYDNLHVQNCTFHAQTNGAIFQYSWRAQGPTKKALIEDCEVVAVEFTFCGDAALGEGGSARSFINLKMNSLENTSFTEQIFKNIFIQGQLIRFISINGKYDKSLGLTFDAQLENITVTNKPKDYNLLYTQGNNKLGFTFKNVTLGGECIDKNSFKNIGDVDLSIYCSD